MRLMTYAATAALACLLILTPFVWASTAEGWTSGIADEKPNDVVQIVAHDHVAVVHSELVFSFHGTLVVVGSSFFVTSRLLSKSFRPALIHAPRRSSDPPVTG